MKHFFDNNRMGALMTIIVLAIGSISIVGIGTSHIAMASQIGKLCVFFACGNANITGGTSGAGGGGQPTPSTATLIVSKVVLNCPAGKTCQPKDFTIKITGVTASPNSFPGDTKGTHVTVSPGKYTVSETLPNPATVVKISFSGDCTANSPDFSTASGDINAGDTKACTIINDVQSP